MDWNCVKLELAPEHMEVLCALLAREGILEFAVSDPEELRAFMDTSVYYDYVDEQLLHTTNTVVDIYLEKNQAGYEKRRGVLRILEELKAQGIKVFLDVTGVKDEDWMNNWKKYFKPIPVGKKLMIKPSWEELPEADGRRVLEIDPSSSFGTGTHETTRLCLEALEEVIHEGCEMLDMGCGSGILSVAALLLGAKNATAVDIEEEAIRVTKENMERNGLEDSRYRVLKGNVLEEEAARDFISDRTYAVIAANIVAAVVMRMRPLFSGLLQKEGTLILSGIIRERAEEVKNEYLSNGFQVISEKTEGEWAALVLRRNA